MALDGIVLSAIANELRAHLPIRINRISEASSSELVFNVHTNGVRTNLIISTHAQFNRISLSEKNYSLYDNPSGFVMLLRKYLLNGVINEIIQNDYDRYLLLKINARDELYDERHFILSIELMGKYANIVFVDEDSNKILDALKRIPPFENSKRTILSGAQFELIPSQNKKDPFLNPFINFEESLVNQLSGFSKLLEEEVRYRMQHGQSYDEIKKLLKNSNKLYVTNLTNKTEFHIIPLTHLNSTYQTYQLFEGFDEIYFEAEEKERIKDISNDLYAFVKRQLKHYESKIIKLNESMEKSLHSEEDRICGELLFTYGNLKEKGLSEIEVEDYDGNKHLIVLNPKLSIKENAGKYFQTYQKKRKSIAYIDEQLNIAENEKDYFLSLQEQLSYANYLDAIDIREELIRNGYIRKNDKNPKKDKKKEKKVHLYQLKFKDVTITFGKNNIQNDYLTFKYAKSNYTWFHAQGFHGSHLVVDSSDLDEDTIRLCANLAAYFSSGRLSSSVPVDYCSIKEIKKIKGAKAGFVSLGHHKTIYIDPELDPNLKIKTI